MSRHTELTTVYKFGIFTFEVTKWHDERVDLKVFGPNGEVLESDTYGSWMCTNPPWVTDDLLTENCIDFHDKPTISSKPENFDGVLEVHTASHITEDLRSEEQLELYHERRDTEKME